MITCGGQATIPMVAAVSSIVPVPYAEIVATIASRSAGPGTRESIDAFTRTTARGLERDRRRAARQGDRHPQPGRSTIMMRDTVYVAVPEDADEDAIGESIAAMRDRVAGYVPGYRVRTDPVFDPGRVIDLPRGRGCGRLPASVRREPRHHDGGRHARRRGARRALTPGGRRMSRQVTLVDSTLRDGSHAKGHNFTMAHAAAYRRRPRRRRRAGDRDQPRRRTGRVFVQLRVLADERVRAAGGGGGSGDATPSSPCCCSRASGSWRTWIAPQRPARPSRASPRTAPRPTSRLRISVTRAIST